MRGGKYFKYKIHYENVVFGRFGAIKNDQLIKKCHTLQFYFSLIITGGVIFSFSFPGASNS